ncbi:putative ribonuclease H-like domain-containing protein [Tanacetum coccineum]
MTGNRSYLIDYEEIDGGFVAFGGSTKGGKITGKGKIRTGKLDIKDVYFVKELKFNLFSVSQMCDKKNSVLFTNTECIVLSLDFKLTDESHVLLKVPRKDNMYSIDLKNAIPQGGLTCFFEKATTDESNLWHRRLRHVNFKTINKLVKGNLARGLPSKLLEINQTCVSCQKGKQHRASCKTKIVSSISQPLQMLHMDLFGLTFVKSLMKKMYCLFVTDDYSRFSWVFFLATKDETSEILKTFITGIENLIDLKAEAVNTACYVQNRVLVINPHNKTPYELFLGRKPALSFMRPFGCRVTILNTIDHLGKFDEKADEGFFIGHSTNSKAFRVFNSRTRIVEENLHVKFNEDTPNITGSGPKWLFNIDALTKSMNYEPVTVPGKDYILLPVLTKDPQLSSSSEDFSDAGFKPLGEEEKKDAKHPENEDNQVLNIEKTRFNQEQDTNINNTNNINTVSSPINAAGINDNDVDENIVIGCADDPNMPNLEEIVYSDDDESIGAEADMTNLDTNFPVSPILTTRIHKDHPGYTQEEGIDYDEFFAPVARIGAIRLFLAYASFKDFVVYQMDVKSAFLYSKIEEEIYVCQPPGFEDPEFPDRVYKTASTPMETSKPLLKDAEAEDVDVHLYRSMIGSLMYLTASRHDIMFVVCKSITGGCLEWNGIAAKDEIQVSVVRVTYYWATEISQSSRHIHLVSDETIIKEWEDRMERAATTASSLEAKQDSGNIERSQSMATLNESLPQGTGLCSGPRVNTLGSGEDSMKLNELMELCTKLSEWILALG